MASTVWRGYLTFGLVSLPVRLFRAARPERIQLRQIAKRAGPALVRDEVKSEAQVTPTFVLRQ